MRVGSLWKGPPGGPVAQGTISILGHDIKIYIWKNDKKERATQPALIISVPSAPRKESPKPRTDDHDILAALR